METKSEVIHFRLSPSSKLYLEELAKKERTNCTQYLTTVIREKFREHISDLAGHKAMNEALQETNFPEMMKLLGGFEKVKDILREPKDIEALLTPEDFKKFSASFKIHHLEYKRKIAKEFGYVYCLGEDPELLDIE